MLRMLSKQAHGPTKRFRKSDALSRDMSRVDCVILCGGQGSRLYPLTQTRCKPGVPFGGYYRLIDIALTNALDARCRQVFVITQFLSSLLHQHIYQTYTSSVTGHGIVMLTAEQRPTEQGWFQGTADAVRKNLSYLEDSSAEYVLILSGDQLYHLDFTKMLEAAEKTNADLLIASLPVEANTASRLGLLQINNNYSIKDFVEKPTDPEVLHRFICPPKVIEAFKPGLETSLYLGSMGIYLFKREALFRLLLADPREDFGKHLILTQLAKGKCFAFVYDGYWEDVGTVDSFFRANIALTRKEPSFNCYSETLSLYTTRMPLPPAKIFQTRVNHSLICDGSVVEASEVTSSILGPRTVVRPGTIIQEAYLMGNESYLDRALQPIEIGRGCTIHRAILDSNVSLGNNVRLMNQEKRIHYDGERVYIRDGILIVPRGTHLPDGFVL